MGGLSLSQSIVPMWVLTFTSFTSHCESVIYPGMSGQAFLINCNWLFTTIWTILSPFLSQTIHDNIQIVGYDWKKYLKNIVDLKKLPPCLGGKGPKLRKHPLYLAWRTTVVDDTRTSQGDRTNTREEDKIPRLQKDKENEEYSRKSTSSERGDITPSSHRDEPTTNLKFTGDDTKSN